MLIDTHAHLNFPELLKDIDGVLERAKEAGIEKIICVGTNLEDSKMAIELAQKYESIFATVGIHPENNCEDWDEFEKLAKSPKVIGIGECGLDNKVGLPNQKEIFEKQIKIAGKLDLPLVIHCRNAQEELVEMLKQVQHDTLRGVLHCFAGGMEIPENFYVSFAGNVTFKNAKNLQELAKLIPLEKLLVETDCPFLAPEPLRGSQNEPVNVKITASKLAEIKNVSLEKIAEMTTKNANELFHF